MTEHRTAVRVAELLAGWGLSVRSGIGRTGVVTTLEGTRSNVRSIGFRAELNAWATKDARSRGQMINEMIGTLALSRNPVPGSGILKPLDWRNYPVPLLYMDKWAVYYSMSAQ